MVMDDCLVSILEVIAVTNIHDVFGVVSEDRTAEGWNPIGQVFEAGVIKGVQKAEGSSHRPVFLPDLLGGLIETELIIGRFVLAFLGLLRDVRDRRKSLAG